jgi:hypothetical protein
MPAGKPHDFEAVFVDLCAGEPLRKSLAAHDIDTRTFYRAINADPDLCQRYARAKQDGMDAIADEAIEIIDEEPQRIIRYGKDGEDVSGGVDSAYVQWQKNRVDTRKWLLAKLAPKKYGERTILAGDAENPLFESADPIAALLQRPALRDGDQGVAGEDSETIQ